MAGRKPDPLGHLSSEQIRQLMSRYYAGEPTANLIHEFGLSLQPSSLYRAFPRAAHDDKACPYCRVTMESYRPSRSGSPPAPFCPTCNHQDSSQCSCTSCRERARQLWEHQAQQQRQQVRETYSQSRAQARTPESVTFRERVLLSAILRSSSSENPIYIEPLDSVPHAITPTPDYDYKVLSELYHSNLLVVHPSSPMDALTFPKDGSWSFFLKKVWYELNVEPRTEAIIRHLIHPPAVSSDPSEVQAARELWREIAVQEVLQYLKVQMTKYRFSFDPGDKTIASVHFLLDNFSTAQANGFVWTAAKDAAAMVQARTSTAAQVSQRIPELMRRTAERWLSNHWSAKNFGRDFNCPQSVLAALFFNAVLGIGDEGFNMPMRDWYPPQDTGPYGPSSILGTEPGVAQSPEDQNPIPASNPESVEVPAPDDDLDELSEQDDYALMVKAVISHLQALAVLDSRISRQAANPGGGLIDRVVAHLRSLRACGEFQGKIRRRTAIRAIREASHVLQGGRKADPSDA